jgi:hypothetical protein
MLDRWFEALDELADRHGVYKLETIGDAYIAATNLIAPQADHAARLARFALAAAAAAEATPVDPAEPALGCLRIRVGLSAGPCTATVIGRRNPKCARRAICLHKPTIPHALTVVLLYLRYLHCCSSPAKFGDAHSVPIEEYARTSLAFNLTPD